MNSMNNIDREVYYVQNPAIGAAVLWQFICGYYSKESKAVPFPLLFVVLPIIFREDLCTIIKTTQKGKGLSKVSEKLFKEKKNDDLYTINNTAIALRPLTMDSFNIGVSAKLFTMDISTATVFPLTQVKKSGLATPTKRLLDAAEKLGIWCEELSLLEICEWLKVRF